MCCTIDDQVCDVGFGDEESAGEEYEVGEYVLEDLELGSPEEAGSFFSQKIQEKK